MLLLLGTYTFIKSYSFRIHIPRLYEVYTLTNIMTHDALTGKESQPYVLSTKGLKGKGSGQFSQFS